MPFDFFFSLGNNNKKKSIITLPTLFYAHNIFLWARDSSPNKSNWWAAKLDAYLSWNCLWKQGCFSQCIRAPAAALSRRKVLAVPPPGAAWQVAALPTSISSTPNWAITELVLLCSELSTVNRIPLGWSSSIFFCPAWRFPACVMPEFLLSVSWRGSTARGTGPWSSWMCSCHLPLGCHPQGLVFKALPREVGNQGSATSPAQAELQLSLLTFPHPKKLVLF